MSDKFLEPSEVKQSPYEATDKKVIPELDYSGASEANPRRYGTGTRFPDGDANVLPKTQPLEHFKELDFSESALIRAQEMASTEPKLSNSELREKLLDLAEVKQDFPELERQLNIQIARTSNSAVDIRRVKEGFKTIIPESQESQERLKKVIDVFVPED